MDDRLRKSDYEVRSMAFESALVLVQRYHYSRSAGAVPIYVFGLFRRGSFFDNEALGCCIWCNTTMDAAIKWLPENPNGVLALSRMVVVPDVPKNACSFMLMRSVRMIDAKKYPMLVTYADEWQGHTGNVYKSCGWKYSGKTKPEATFVRNGVMRSRKMSRKTQTKEEMIARGFECVGNHSRHRYCLDRRTTTQVRSTLDDTLMSSPSG